MSPARSISWWLSTSASAGVSLAVLIGYCESLIGARVFYRVEESRILSGDHLLKFAPRFRPQYRATLDVPEPEPGECPERGAGYRQRDQAAAQGDLPAAEPADHRMPLRRLLRHCRRHRQALRACGHGGVRGDDLRYARWQ